MSRASLRTLSAAVTMMSGRRPVRAMSIAAAALSGRASLSGRTALSGRAPLCAMLIAITALTSARAIADESSPAALPPIASLLPPPPDKTPRATVMLADYRYDDLLWENDKTAHRIYGHALEAAEPPSGSGIDSWGKNVTWPFMDRQLRTGDQHAYHGEGIDFYNVGTGRGAGGLGIWHDNKLWTSRNYRSFKILRSGGEIAEFDVDYAPWPVDVERRVWEKRRFALPLGTHFTRMTSTIQSDKPDALIVGIGIGKRTTGDGGELTVDRPHGVLSWWGPEDKGHGRMAVALRVDPAMIVDIRSDADNQLVLLRVTPGKPFVYYSGSAWNLGEGEFHDRAAWDRYAAQAAVDFRPSLNPRSP